VKEMNKNKTIRYGENWIDENELPVSRLLKPIRKKDDLYPKDEEERREYWDFIYWAMTREHAVLLSIPTQKDESNFCFSDFDELGNDVSAFNTMDFQRLCPDRFNKYHYKLKKVYEKVKDLALLHSCISYTEGKKNILQRYNNLVENEFRDKAKMYLETYKKYPYWVDKDKLIEKIAELNSRIRKCKRIWKENAYSD